MANRFDAGVSYYTNGTALVMVSFPEDEIKCRWCRFLRQDAGSTRLKCVLTDEILYGPDLIGDHCPLKIEEVEK